MDAPEPVGGQGQYQIINASGGTYGDADITHLLAGSGGGGGNERQGGGGGALKIVSPGTLTIGANIWLVEEPVGLVGTKHDEAEVLVRVEPFI